MLVYNWCVCRPAEDSPNAENIHAAFFAHWSGNEAAFKPQPDVNNKAE